MKIKEKNQGLILGWPTRFDSNEEAKRDKTPEFIKKEKQEQLSYAIKYENDGHLVTFAPTGSGKGVSVIIPNLFYYTGPVIVIDPKGENFAVTVRFRKSLGQEIFLLDPFKAVSDEILEKAGIERDSLNPLDLYKISGNSIQNDSQMIADLLSGGGSFGSDPFWDLSGLKLLSGLIAHEMDLAKREKRPTRFEQIIDTVFAEDPVHKMAIILDTQKPSKFVVRSVAGGFLNIVDKTRDGILATTQSFVSLLMSGDLLNYLNQSTIDLEQIQKGENYTLYIVIPPNKLGSHSFLLKTWVGVLMHSIMERKSLPEKRTLFILDECANLGEMDVLRKAVTLLRGYGLQVWMFFQDLSQMKMLYPHDYTTMINNCGVLQTFGISRRSGSDPLASIIGTYRGTEILSLDKTQQILSISPGKVRIARLMKYFRDKAFDGLFDENPLILSEEERKKNHWLIKHRNKSRF